MSATSPSAALRLAAAYGPFFTLHPDPDGRFAPLDDAALADRVAATRAALARRAGQPVAERVAASVTHLDLAARVLSPALVTGALTGWVPDLTDLVWRDPPLELGVARLRAGSIAEAVAAAEALGAALAPGLPARVRRGNIASVVASAGRLAPVCAGLAAEVLSGMPDAGSGQPVGFRRSTCCLYYRVGPRAGLCGDCVLTRRPSG